MWTNNQVDLLSVIDSFPHKSDKAVCVWIELMS